VVNQFLICKVNSPYLIRSVPPESDFQGKVLHFIALLVLRECGHLDQVDSEIFRLMKATALSIPHILEAKAMDKL